MNTSLNARYSAREGSRAARPISHSSLPRLSLYRAGLSYGIKRTGTPSLTASARASSTETPPSWPSIPRVTRTGLEAIKAARSSPFGASSETGFWARPCPLHIAQKITPAIALRYNLATVLMCSFFAASLSVTLRRSRGRRNKWDEDAHRPRRIGLRLRDAQDARKRGNTR
jgi:hypothetical protein